METYVAIRALCKPICNNKEPISKDLLLLSGLRLWYPSISFGYEINLKVLMYLVLLYLKG